MLFPQEIEEPGNTPQGHSIQLGVLFTYSFTRKEQGVCVHMYAVLGLLWLLSIDLPLCGCRENACWSRRMLTDKRRWRI